LQILLGLIGHHISLPSKATGRGQLFFTNAILCLKSGTSQSAVYQGWFQNCARFLRSQVEIVKPQVVVCLGQHAYNALLESYNLKRSPFRRVVDSHQPMALSSGIWAFAVYHCGPRILNTHRKWADQERDWQCIGEWMRSNCRAG
jgi:uracil-DNA glycosylase family 4